MIGLEWVINMIPERRDEIAGYESSFGILEFGDRIEKGDEYYNPFEDKWLPIDERSIGDEWDSDYYKPMRRRL